MISISSFVLPAAGMRILFLGNSHTHLHDVPGMVRSLLASSTPKRSIWVDSRSNINLNALGQDPATFKLIQSGKWTHVVLQGAEISSSHKFVYSQADGLKLAQTAHKSGSKVFYFAEWPRKGWDETKFIEDVYVKMQKQSLGSKVIPVGRAFDKANSLKPAVELLSLDGNHANLAGAYLASCVIANWLSEKPASFTYEPSNLRGKGAFLRGIAAQFEP